MHKTIWMILMLLLPLTSLAQTAEERAEQMKANAEYICGEGWGDTYNSADQAALADLISKISLNISNSFEIKEEEFNTNSSFDSKTAITSVMNSYAQATLTNTFNLVISNTPQTHVLRYIRKSEVNKIFDERKEKVFDYVRSAMRAEEKAKIDDARWCYRYRQPACQERGRREGLDQWFYPLHPERQGTQGNGIQHDGYTREDRGCRGWRNRLCQRPAFRHLYRQQQEGGYQTIAPLF